MSGALGAAAAAAAAAPCLPSRHGSRCQPFEARRQRQPAAALSPHPALTHRALLADPKPKPHAPVGSTCMMAAESQPPALDPPVSPSRLPVTAPACVGFGVFLHWHVHLKCAIGGPGRCVIPLDPPPAEEAPRTCPCNVAARLRPAHGVVQGARHGICCWRLGVDVPARMRTTRGAAPQHQAPMQYSAYCLCLCRQCIPGWPLSWRREQGVAVTGAGRAPDCHAGGSVAPGAGRPSDGAAPFNIACWGGARGHSTPSLCHFVSSTAAPLAHLACLPRNPTPAHAAGQQREPQRLVRELTGSSERLGDARAAWWWSGCGTSRGH